MHGNCFQLCHTDSGQHGLCIVVEARSAMDDFNDSDLSALFAEVDQLEATRKASNNGNKVRDMFACMNAHKGVVAAHRRDLNFVKA